MKAMVEKLFSTSGRMKAVVAMHLQDEQPAEEISGGQRRQKKEEKKSEAEKDEDGADRRSKR